MFKGLRIAAYKLMQLVLAGLGGYPTKDPESEDDMLAAGSWALVIFAGLLAVIAFVIIKAIL